MRRLHVLEVVEPAVWAEVEAVVDLAPLVEAELCPRRRAVRRGAERAIVPALKRRGLAVLVREGSGSGAAPVEPADVGGLGEQARKVLATAQRRAVRGIVAGARAWHPVRDRVAVEELAGAGLIEPVGEASLMGAWRLHPGLPLPPEPAWELSEAFFPAPDDLEDPPVALSRVLLDAAAMAAGVRLVAPRRTFGGHLDKASCRRLGRRLGDGELAATGELGRADPRWSRALDVLFGLEAVVEDEVQRTLHVRDAVLGSVLDGEAGEVLDRVVRRLAPPGATALLGALRAAVAQAGEEAVDEVILLELLAEQQGGAWSVDAEAFVEEEGPLLADALELLAGLGLIRRGPGAFAATDDGRTWAGLVGPRAPVWITSDLEVVVPPGGIGAWERYLLERLAVPVARDVVDRLRLHRDGLADWLVDRSVEEALALLGGIAPAVPATVAETLRAWAASLTRVVLTKDVDLPV